MNKIHKKFTPAFTWYPTLTPPTHPVLEINIPYAGMKACFLCLFSVNIKEIL